MRLKKEACSQSIWGTYVKERNLLSAGIVSKGCRESCFLDANLGWKFNDGSFENSILLAVGEDKDVKKKLIFFIFFFPPLIFCCIWTLHSADK